MVTRQPTLDAVIEGRNRGIKEWKFQRRAGMGQKVLEGSRSEENGKTSNTYMEYGLSPPRRIESRSRQGNGYETSPYHGNRFLHKVTCTFPPDTLCQKAHESEEAAGQESCQKRRLATSRARGALDKGSGSSPLTMRAPGSCYKRSMCTGYEPSSRYHDMELGSYFVSATTNKRQSSSKRTGT